MPTFASSIDPGKQVEYTWHTPLSGQSAYKGQFANDAARVTAAVQFPGSQISTALQVFLGWSRIARDPNSGVRYISRSVPMAFPGVLNLDNQPYLYAVSAPNWEGLEYKGEQGLDGFPIYTLARLDLTFVPLTYKVLPDDDTSLVGDGTLDLNPDESTLNRYVTRGVIQPVDRQVTLPRGLMRWVLESGDPGYTAGPSYTPGPVLLESVARTEPAYDVVYIHHLRPDLPISTLIDCLGTVNVTEFDGWPAGSLLLTGVDVRPINLPIGEIAWDFHFKMRFLRRHDKVSGAYKGWNYQLRFFKDGANPKAGFRLLTVDGKPNGDTILEPYEFKNLFRPE